MFTALKHPKVVALGEFGLDDGWAKNDDTKFAIQQRIFKQQISLAIEAKKPMVLHIRGFNALAAAKYILGKSSNKIKFMMIISVHDHFIVVQTDSVLKDWQFL